MLVQEQKTMVLENETIEESIPSNQVTKAKN